METIEQYIEKWAKKKRLWEDGETHVYNDEGDWEVRNPKCKFYAWCDDGYCGYGVAISVPDEVLKQFYNK